MMSCVSYILASCFFDVSAAKAIQLMLWSSVGRAVFLWLSYESRS